MTKQPDERCEYSHNGNHSWVFQDSENPDQGTCRYHDEGCDARTQCPEPPRMKYIPNPIWAGALDDAYGNIKAL